MPELMRYTIMARHPSGRPILDVELVASSERAAITRTRWTLANRDNDTRWLNGVFTVLECSPVTRD